MMKSNVTGLSGEEAKYSLDWTSKVKVAQPPFYRKPALFMLVCSTKRTR